MFDETPIKIVVKNGRWDAFGETTLRSEYLFQVLRQQGGIAESVPDGTYEFNARIRGLKLITNLTPVQD